MEKTFAFSNSNDGGIELSEKLDFLKNILSEMGSVLLAYSGGMDSTFLLKVASSVLKERVVAVTATSETYPKRELDETRQNTKLQGVKHITVNTKKLDDDNFTSNPPERCYYCKKELFSKLLELASRYSLNCVIDGSNYDDRQDFRPGLKAASELGIRSPLQEAALTKEEIRILSKEMNLPTWDKPPQPCLASRIPYGIRITGEKLLRVEEAEEFLAGFGIKQLRVRDHDDVARIEVFKEDMPLLLDGETSIRIVNKFKALGYTYVALDIQGYRMGSMNEPLKRKD